jgi:type VI secretion system protein ImpK
VDSMYRGIAEALIAAEPLGSARSLPPPDRLREELLGVLSRMVSRCRQAGVPDAEIAEARYALVAFIDERLLKATWHGREQWMSNPLQLQLYGEYTAGENFFARMRALLQAGATSRALQVYYLCLALGFVGALPASRTTQSVQSYLEAARARLAQADPGAPISPHAVPIERRMPTTSNPRLLLASVLGCAFVVIFGLGVLGWSLGNKLHGAARDLAVAGATRHRAAGAER